MDCPTCRWCHKPGPIDATWGLCGSCEATLPKPDVDPPAPRRRAARFDLASVAVPPPVCGGSPEATSAADEHRMFLMLDNMAFDVHVLWVNGTITDGERDRMTEGIWRRMEKIDADRIMLAALGVPPVYGGAPDDDDPIHRGSISIEVRVIEAGDIRYEGEPRSGPNPPRVLLETTERGARLLAARLHEKAVITLQPKAAGA